MDNEHNTLNWTPRSLKIRDQTDIVVIGGGITGVCAACAASRRGKSVALIENFSQLGGVGTVGGVSGFCGETTGVGQTFNEILKELEEHHALGQYKPARKNNLGARGYNREVLALILQEMVLAAGVHLWLHTKAADVIYNTDENGEKQIIGIIVANAAGLEVITGEQFIDCTGNAQIVVAAEGETIKGREKDEVQLPMSIMFFTQYGSRLRSPKINLQRFFPWNPITTKKELPMTSFSPNGFSKGKGIKVKIPNYDATDPKQLTEAEIQAHRKMCQVLDFYQKNARSPLRYDHCAPIIGIREGRRIKGEYYLTLPEIRQACEFSDAIAVGTFPLDAHEPGDDKRTYILPRDQMKVPPYQILLRSLIPKGFSNLLAAGRLLSADQLTLSSARVMTTCAMMGESAGEASALALEKQIPIKSFSSDQIEELQQRLVSGGMKLDLEYYNNT